MTRSLLITLSFLVVSPFCYASSGGAGPLVLALAFVIALLPSFVAIKGIISIRKNHGNNPKSTRCIVMLVSSILVSFVLLFISTGALAILCFLLPLLSSYYCFNVVLPDAKQN